MLGVIGRHIARRDGVDVDVVFRPFVRQQTGHAHHAAFRSGIRRHADTALEREHGGDINDLAAIALSDEVFRRCLGHKKDAFNIQVHHVIPVLLAEIDRVFATDQASVIDKNVDFAELGHRTIQQCRDTVDFTQVSRQAQETTAQRRNALDGFGRFNNVDTHDIATRFRQTQRHALAQTCITPGNDSHFTLKRECIQNHVGSLIFQRLHPQAYFRYACGA